MREKGSKVNIDYEKTIGFFDRRAKKFKEDNPYSVTMYQDSNPELVKARNKKETEKLIPKLMLDSNSKILDIACGIGRWSDAITDDISEYLGLDFCKDFITMAKDRNKDKSNRDFLVSSSVEVEKCLQDNKKGLYNRVLIIGSLMYLNDDDVYSTLSQLENVLEESSIICIREPIGITERLTLKEQFSDELEDTYNAIYRTRDELEELFNNTLISKGFNIEEKAFLFDDNNLNNRKETAQFYYILKR